MSGRPALMVALVLLGLTPITGVAQQARTGSPHGRVAATENCLGCHTPQSWRPAKSRLDFDHDDSGFALDGRHRGVTCTLCHIDLRFDRPKIGTVDCGSCHVDVHQGRLATDCVACHNTTSFRSVAGLAVHAKTSFPLRGVHMQLSCESCHRDDRDGAYVPLDIDCISCHEEDYAKAGTVDHESAGFPTDCEQCHSGLTWGSDGTFDHLAASKGFALLGAHAALTCTECHNTPGMGLKFPAPSNVNDCLTCHQADYEREHGGLGFPSNCRDCHSNVSWGGASFDHLAVSQGFALQGAHATLACTGCHNQPDMTLRFPPPTDVNDCIACHQADYDSQHGSSGFPTTCTDCHTNLNWGGASFDHSTVGGGFALLGAHAALSCSSCHQTPGTELLFPPPTDVNDCIACHQDDYDREHAGSGFATTCTNCHTNLTWDGASFDHASVSNGFVLEGAHISLACTSCHITPSMQLLFPVPNGSSDCIACHQDEYDLQHATEAYPTQCFDCHTTSSWLGSTFDHNAYFPINSGIHAGKWGNCATCHTVPENFTVFTCFNCHQHDQSKMDPAHSGENGYVYDSNACYSCHPDGRN